MSTVGYCPMSCRNPYQDALHSVPVEHWCSPGSGEVSKTAVNKFPYRR